MNWLVAFIQRWLLACLLILPLVGAGLAPAGFQDANAEAITLRIDGAKTFPTASLRGVLQPELDAWKSGLTGSLVAQDCAFEVEQYYQRRGFADARVNATWSQKPPVIHVVIHEGERRWIGEWNWPGALDEDGLRASDLVVLYKPEHTKGDPLPKVDRDLRQLERAVETRYRSRGFLKAKAGPTTSVELSPDSNGRSITLPIEPGPLFRLGARDHDLPAEIALAIGLEPALDKVTRDVRAAAGSEDTEATAPAFRLEWINGWVRAAQQVLGDAGYLDAKVQAQPILKDAVVDVQISIQPGEIVRLGAIRLPEDLGLRASFVHRQMDLAEGDLLTPARIDRTLARLYRTGRFDHVRLTTQGEGPQRDLVMEASEPPEREAFIEPGYGSFERGRVRAGWRHHNVGDVGRAMRVEGTLAERADRLVVGWNDPWTLPNDWVLDATIDTSLRKLPALNRRTSSAGVFGSKTFGSHLRWTTDIGLRFARIAVSEVRVDLLANPELAEDLASTTIEWGLHYDSRNHPLLPRSGKYASLVLQHALNATGSASRYSKAQLGWSQFHTLSEKQTLALGVRAAAVIPEGSGSLPLGLRLFSGGENSVRSFRESELGPVDSLGTALGGEARSTFSIEFLQDLGASRWQGALFVDVGNVSAEASDIFRFEDMQTALGVGARYLLPIGPLRLDLGINPDPDPGAAHSVLHFSVGMAF